MHASCRAGATAAGALRRFRSGPATSAWSRSTRTPAGSQTAPGIIAGRPACVERSIPSDPDRRSVVPQTGDNRKNGRSRCRRQPSAGTCAPRKSPSSSMCHQRRSAAGRRRACCPTSVPWAATDATPTRRSGPCWKPCPSPPRPASRAPRLTALAPLCPWLGGRSDRPPLDRGGPEQPPDPQAVSVVLVGSDEPTRVGQPHRVQRQPSGSPGSARAVGTASGLGVSRPRRAVSSRGRLRCAAATASRSGRWPARSASPTTTAGRRP